MCWEENKQGKTLDNTRSLRIVGSFQMLLEFLLPLSAWKSEEVADSPSLSHRINRGVCVCVCARARVCVCVCVNTNISESMGSGPRVPGFQCWFILVEWFFSFPPHTACPPWHIRTRAPTSPQGTDPDQVWAHRQTDRQADQCTRGPISPEHRPGPCAGIQTDRRADQLFLGARVKRCPTHTRLTLKLGLEKPSWSWYIWILSSDDSSACLTPNPFNGNNLGSNQFERETS